MPRTLFEMPMRLMTLAILSLACLRAQDLLQALRQHAAKGDPQAQTALGKLYRDGLGVRQDLPEAVRWFRQAADQGYAEAANCLGFLSDYGGGGPHRHR